MRRFLTMAGLATGAALAMAGSALAAADASKQIKVTGEVIDTFCYYSGVMGIPEATLGTAHRTCALWCAAGGIPVGVLADDGTVYMVLKLNGNAPLENKDSLLEIQSNRVTANGKHYVRDGINYLVVENVANNEGIVNQTHEEFGVTPPFAIPKSAQ